MICALLNILVEIVVLGLVVGAVIYMVSPKHGGEFFARLAVFFVGVLLGLCLLHQIAAHIGPSSFLVLAVVASFAAYLIREVRRDHPVRQINTKGAERTPLLPPATHKEEQP